ncbi:MAG TPA: thiol peroxidase [Candidatus Krumholzibacteria bacterium]|jgi:thioredoxin-dependent peroxiredoxin|nr:thiol peroxidase [Candidatus Krumholzibacteria bacterium]
MARITLKGNPIHTSGELPAIGSQAKEFDLVKQDLSTATLASFSGKKKVLNIYVSVDTSICATSVKKFFERARTKPNLVVLNISADLPFAAKRFCGSEGVENAITLSTFRSRFADDYGLKITDGPLTGLCSRAIVVLDENNRVLHTEQVPEIGQEPDYDRALAKV